MWGFNRLTEAPTESRLKRFALQFTQFIIIVLMAGAVLAGLLGEWIDAGAILAIVLLNGIVGFLQEEKAERVMEALKQYAAPTAKVVRDGAPLTIDASALVPGDIVLLESGDHIPADLRIVASSTLRVNEAALTGESLPVNK
jgi:Ca2+-transporting ATPase